MPRHPKGPQSDIEDRENFGFALGDAGDWLDREEVSLMDLFDALEAGKTSFIAARLAVGLDFRAARKDMNDWQKWWAWRAEENEFPYLHESLKQDVLRFPHLRIVLPMRKPEAPA